MISDLRFVLVMISVTLLGIQLLSDIRALEHRWLRRWTPGAMHHVSYCWLAVLYHVFGLVPNRYYGRYFKHRKPGQRYDHPLRIQGNPFLKALPPGLRCEYTAEIIGCPQFMTIPLETRFDSSLSVLYCPEFSQVPSNLEIRGYLDLTGSHGVTEPPIEVNYHCDAVTDPKGVRHYRQDFKAESERVRRLDMKALSATAFHGDWLTGSLALRELDSRSYNNC